MRTNLRILYAAGAVVLAAGMALVASTGTSSQETLVRKCDDPPKNCKDPQWIGDDPNGQCACWMCSNGKTVCVSDTKDKLDLLARMPPMIPAESLSRTEYDRLLILGIFGDHRRDSNVNTNRRPESPHSNNLNQNAVQTNFNVSPDIRVRPRNTNGFEPPR